MPVILFDYLTQQFICHLNNYVSLYFHAIVIKHQLTAKSNVKLSKYLTQYSLDDWRV